MPKLITSAVLMMLALGNVALTQEQDVRSLDLSGLQRPFPKGSAEKPLAIASADELKKAFPEEEVRKRLAQQVDFDKEKLLFFAWSGSGQDKVTFALTKAKDKLTAVFTYQRGLTRDLRTHFRLYALPKDAAWRVERAARQ